MQCLPLSYPAPYKCSNWNIPHRSWMPVSHIWYHHISAVQIQRTREKHIGPFKDQKAPSPSYHRVILNSTRRSKNSMSIAPEANTRKGERTTLHFWGRGDQEPQSISYWNKVSEIITSIIKKKDQKTSCPLYHRQPEGKWRELCCSLWEGTERPTKVMQKHVTPDKTRGKGQIN